MIANIDVCVENEDVSDVGANKNWAIIQVCEGKSRITLDWKIIERLIEIRNNNLNRSLYADRNTES